MNFLNGERNIADIKTISARWMGGKKGEFFRCGFCGHKFKEDDGWRMIYTNNIPKAGGNPLICDNCFIDKEGARQKWKEKCERFEVIIKKEFWMFFRNLYQEG